MVSWAEFERAAPELAAFGPGTARRTGVLPRDASSGRLAARAPGRTVDRDRAAVGAVPSPEPQGGRGAPRRALRAAFPDGQPRRRGWGVPRARMDGAGLRGAPSG